MLGRLGGPACSVVSISIRGRLPPDMTSVVEALAYVENTPWENTPQSCSVAGMESIREVLAANLRRRRAEMAMSQESLAHEAGLDRTYISSIERCVYAASIDVVDSLAKVLEVEASDLLARKDGRGQWVRKPRGGASTGG